MNNLVVNVGDWVVDTNGNKIQFHDMPELPRENIVRLAKKEDFPLDKIPNEYLEKRMYSLVPYNISPIQQAIQAGHAVEQFAFEYGDTVDYIDYIKNWKTWIILNGGTTNSEQIPETGYYKGSLNNIAGELGDWMINNPHDKINFTMFNEPDLNDALTAVSLLVDERVFNRTTFPDFIDWKSNVKITDIIDKNDFKDKTGLNYDKILESKLLDIYFKETCINEKIHFLKELLNSKKLA